MSSKYKLYHNFGDMSDSQESYEIGKNRLMLNSSLNQWDFEGRKARSNQKSAVRHLVQCVTKRACQANRTIMDEARDDMKKLMDMHEQLTSGRSLNDDQKDWLRERFDHYKNMNV